MNIPIQRLTNQCILESSFKKPEQVVNWLLAVQSQDYAGAKWALGIRIANAKDTDIENAFNSGKILRTHVLRPTWHFVTPEDIRWIIHLTAPRIFAANATMHRQLELDNTILSKCNKILIKALRDNNHLTRNELGDLLIKSGIDNPKGIRLAYILMQAELKEIICSGAKQGKNFTYALLDERAPDVKQITRNEALQKLAYRYFYSRGPATVHDFAKWSGLTINDANKGLQEVKSDLNSEIIENKLYWFPEGKTLNKKIQVAHLLSIYDEYISGYKDRSAIVHSSTGKILVNIGNSVTSIIILNGKIIGTWKRAISKNEIEIKINIISSPKGTDRKYIKNAASEYGQFLNLPVVIK